MKQNGASTRPPTFAGIPRRTGTSKTNSPISTKPSSWLAPPEIGWILGDQAPSALFFEAQYAGVIDALRPLRKPGLEVRFAANIDGAEIVDALCHGQRKVGVGLDVVEKLGVALAVEGAGLVGQPGRRLSPRPAAAVHDQHALLAIDTRDPLTDRCVHGG